MIRHTPFDQIVKAVAERPALQQDWTRQRTTAIAVAERFEAGQDAVLLADEVGMGKTYVALAVMADYLLQTERNDRKVLLITPPSHVLRHKWVEEIGSFNGRYVVAPTAGGMRKDMRALNIGSYWDLFRNLNDYDDAARLRVDEDTLLPFLFCLFDWAKSHGLLKKQPRIWPCLQGFEKYGGAHLRFSAQYSAAALWQYLDSEYALERAWFQDQFARLKADNHESWPLANRFKKFTRQQDRFEPNIYVMGMNGLNAPKPDESNNKLFSRFALGFLLSGLHAKTRSDIICALEAAKVLPARVRYARWEAYEKEILATSADDMFGLRGATVRVIKRDDIAASWKALRANVVADAATAFFKHLRDQVFEAKLAEANVGLAIVDEVHNWKAGAHNAKIFQQHYAPFIARKLIMSATPFQVEEGEMARVFNHVLRAGGQTAAAVERIFAKEEGLMGACLVASNAFAVAWKALPTAPDTRALDALLAASTGDEIRACAQALAHDGDASAEELAFANALLVYRAAIDRLESALGAIVVRHTKPRDKRDFRIGEHFHTGHPDGRPRAAMYPSRGYADDDAAMVSFIGMRLGQLALRAGGVARPANARLLSGMSSGTRAYLNGASARGQDAAHAGYRTLFGQVLARTAHPKVAATVQRAFDNFVKGNKTLIFCERVDTLDEIKDALDQRIADHHRAQQGSDDAIQRRSLMKRADLVDNLWWLSLGDAADRSAAFVDDLAGAAGAARAFAQACLADSGDKVTARRVIRLLDASLLAHALKQDARLMARWPHALALFEAVHGVLAGDAGARRSALLQAYLTGAGQHAGERADEVEDADEEGDAAQVERVLDMQYRGRQNLWCAAVRPAFHTVLWNLLDAEAEKLMRGAGADELPLLAFVDIVLELMAGLRKVVLRDDLIARYEGAGGDGTHFARISAGFATLDVGHGETMLTRTQRFVETLVAEDGSIGQADQRESKRKSMWSGISRSAIDYVSKLDGRTNAESRVRLCASFNSPLLPDVLVCSAIGSEGIDLHRHCADVIHHDLPWNPAKLEQRIGRLDRVNSLADPGKGIRIKIGIPFLANNYEKYQYDVVFSRAQKFEVLLGTPDFDGREIDEEVYVEGAESEVVGESDAVAVMREDELMRTLPEPIIRFLRVDLAVA